MVACISYVPYNRPQQDMYTDSNISKDSIHGECLLILLDTRSNITHSILLLDTITNEKTMKLIQLDPIHHYHPASHTIKFQ